MTHILLTATNAVLPIVLIIYLGYFLRQKNFLSPDFLKKGNWLVFHVCLPSMLFINVYDIESTQSIDWGIVVYCCCATVLLFLLGLVTALLATPVPQRRGVITQCVFRSNFAIIGLSLAAALGGQEAITIAAVVSAFTIPLFNILGVVSLSIFLDHHEQQGPKFRSVFINILKNPLIISVLLGFVCLGLRQLEILLWDDVVFTLKDQLAFLYKALSNLKSIASPLALIVLGGQFTFSAVKGLFREIAVGTLWRIVLAPLIGIGLAIVLSRCTNWFHCGPEAFPAMIALFGSPVAVSSAIMAGSMGNDEQLATQLVVWTSLLSIGTIFLLVCILMSAGLLII